MDILTLSLILSSTLAHIDLRIDLRRSMYFCDKTDDTSGHNPYLETDIITSHYHNYHTYK